MPCACDGCVALDHSWNRHTRRATGAASARSRSSSVRIRVLDLFSRRAMVLDMSRASSHALKHPPVTPPSGPAGAPSAFPELGVSIEGERRRGRGAQSNASGRFEAEARVAFDDGWQSLDELPPFKTTVSLDTARKGQPSRRRSSTRIVRSNAARGLIARRMVLRKPCGTRLLTALS